MASQPSIEYESVKTALEAMRHGRTLAVNHPLRYCLCMQLDRGGVFSRYSDGSVHDTVIFDRLAGAIRRKLNRHRALYNLTPVIRHANFEAVKAALAEDFQHPNGELKAWSFLYYRVIRVDLDLSVDDLIRLTPEDRRTLQRRQAHGIHRLTEALNRTEDRLRRKYKQAAQRSQLLSPTAPRLIGRDILIGQAIRRLTDVETPRHVLLYGATGVGKTTLALAIAHRLVESEALRHVAWLNVAEIGSEKLLDTLAHTLGLPTGDDLPLDGYISENDLIVLDDAHVILAESALHDQLLRRIGQARLVLCAQSAGNFIGWLGLRLHIPPLNADDAFTYIAEIAQDKQDDLDYFSQLYRQLGGNPGALRSAILGNTPIAFVADQLYGTTWAQSSTLTQVLWIALLLAPNNNLMLPQLYELMPTRSVDVINKAVAELQNESAIETGRDWLRLTPGARTFGEQLIRNPSQRRLVTTVVNLWKDHLAKTPTLAGCLSIIHAMQAAHLVSDVQLDVVYAFASMIQHGGAWEAWVRALELLRPAVDLTDQLWIGIRLGVARRWLAQWDAAAYVLAEVIQTAGNNGLFDVQAEAMLELATVQRYQRRYEAAVQLIARSERYYQRRETIEGLAQVSVERTLLALIMNDRNGAETALNALYDYERKDSARVMSLAAQVAYHKNALSEALHYGLSTQDTQADDLPRQGRTAAFLGQVYAGLGERNDAIDQLLGGIKLMGQTGDRYGETRARMNLGAVYMGQGNLRNALDYLRVLPAEFEALGDVESLQATAANLDILNKAARQWRQGHNQIL